MKKEIGNVDAIEVEAVSAAFVENFALKVFQSADNEDRKGVATKSVYIFKLCLFTYSYFGLGQLQRNFSRLLIS